jgi:divalent metal cation (Fe/Co/Zn/Cd) transporter
MSSTTAIALGISTGSLVLVAFGAAGLLDVAGSISLIVHFHHALRHDQFSQRHERLALRLVIGGLVAVGALTSAESGRRLAEGTHPSAGAAGVALASASGLMLGFLSRRKRTIAGDIPSRALRADGWLSATGALLAGVTVAGTGLSTTFGWWWADPIAAGVIAICAVGIALVMARPDVEPSTADQC